MTRLRQNPWVSLVLLSLGFFMILLDTTIVNIAIPSIIEDFQAPIDLILWVLNAYIVVYAALLITMGRLGELFSQRSLYVAGLALFTLASAAAGLAQNVDQLIAARVAQGVAAAMLAPQTLAMLSAIFPPERRGAAFGVWSAVGGLAAIAGPTLGGAIVSDASWRWIFYVNVPIGAVTIVLSQLLIPELRSRRRHGLDWAGFTLSGLGLVLVTFGLIEGEKYSWGHVGPIAGHVLPGVVTIPAVIAIGVALLVAFLVVERRSPAPLVPLELLRDRNFVVMNVLAAVVSFGLLGLLLPFVIYLQSVLGMSAFAAGLTIVPISAVSLLIAPFAGRIADGANGRYLLMFGLACFSLGLWLLTMMAAANSHWYDFALAQVVAGIGFGCTLAPITTIALRNVGPWMAGSASGVLNTSRQAGGVLGGAVVGAVLQNRLAAALSVQAVAHSAAVPPQLRATFISFLGRRSGSGVAVAPGQLQASLPVTDTVTPGDAAHLLAVAHDVFVAAYVQALRPTLMVPVAILLASALAYLLVERIAMARAGRGLEPTATPQRDDIVA